MPRMLASGSQREVNMLNIGVDVGGTFTDFAVFDEETGEIRVGKVATTPQDPTLAFMEGLRQMKIDLGKARRIVHGTTIATNAVVERKGARTAFITTQGHRDVLEFGQLRRYVKVDCGTPTGSDRRLTFPVVCASKLPKGCCSTGKP